MRMFKNWFGKKESSCCDIKMEEVKPEENCYSNEKNDICCGANQERDQVYPDLLRQSK
ncbi:hypothetical protein [Ammoniphilus sp. YIM 78166]|uniref:hypothetical protein n=1 Tax=Ammoniphilus sp. YIM 78166 TaxID=1644106 RepID=UPI00143203C5|nr:hypothetical protein [Ammoniphilus sp. YIM 78166]